MASFQDSLFILVSKIMKILFSTPKEKDRNKKLNDCLKLNVSYSECLELSCKSVEIDISATITLSLFHIVKCNSPHSRQWEIMITKPNVFWPNS